MFKAMRTLLSRVLAWRLKGFRIELENGAVLDFWFLKEREGFYVMEPSHANKVLREEALRHYLQMHHPVREFMMFFRATDSQDRLVVGKHLSLLIGTIVVPMIYWRSVRYTVDGGRIISVKKLWIRMTRKRQ